MRVKTGKIDTIDSVVSSRYSIKGNNVFVLIKHLMLLPRPLARITAFAFALYLLD
jgi:hypothetical protein